VGQLNRHNFAKWQRDYRLHYFVETGTWKGDGLLAARAAHFQRLLSIEASPELAIKATARMECACRGTTWQGRWEILVGDSADCIKEVLLRLSAWSAPVLWWLDAHLPERYGAEATRLPLVMELHEVLRWPHRSHAGDVFLLDDLRLYEAGPYASGNFPGGPPGDRGDWTLLLKALSNTHTIHRDYRDEGYLVALPKDE